MTTTHHTHTNTTSNYQVVGNHDQVISEHPTLAAANASREAIGGESDCGETQWGIIEIIAPGGRTEGDMMRPETAGPDSSEFLKSFGL